MNIAINAITLAHIDRNAPVGIFDSGLGGLSVLRAVRTQLPAESFIYAADSRYAPYGQRDSNFIIDRTLTICEWLATQGAKVLVIACNTATVGSIALARTKLLIPIIGVEPGIKPAVLQSRSHVVGVLATQVTLMSALFQALCTRHDADCRFLCQPGYGLVEAIERCDIGSPQLRALLRRYLEPMLEAGADTLVLGCTHYTFLNTAIRKVVGKRMSLIDTSAAIARQLARVLRQYSLATSSIVPAALPRLCTTSNDGKQLRQMALTLLQIDVPIERVQIPSKHNTLISLSV